MKRNHIVIILIIPVIAVIVSLVLLFVIFAGQRNRLKRKCSVEVTAEIVQMKSEYFKGKHAGYTAYTPVYKYTYLSQEYESSGRIYDQYDPYFVGKQVTVFINPDHPSEFYDPVRDTKKAVSFLVAFSLVLLFLAVPSVTFLIMLRKAEADARREEEVW